MVRFTPLYNGKFYCNCSSMEVFSAYMDLSITGSASTCSQKFPLTTYNLSGRSEYNSIRIADLKSLTVQLSDYTFSTQLNNSTGKE
jgi:hypothetical protein